MRRGVGVRLIENIGSTIVVQGVEKASRLLGDSDIQKEIGLPKARQLMKEVGELRLVDSGGLGSKLTNNAFELVKTPLISNAEGFINNLVPGTSISMNRLITGTWKDTLLDVKRINDGYTKTQMLWGIMWLLGLSTVYALFSSCLRWSWQKRREPKIDGKLP